jgi:hypothetical protein
VSVRCGSMAKRCDAHNASLRKYYLDQVLGFVLSLAHFPRDSILTSLQRPCRTVVLSAMVAPRHLRFSSEVHQLKHP